jgi:hypothetical protein
MTNGGGVASRGFIFQAVIALIECLDSESDWDQIKNEPKTEETQVLKQNILKAEKSLSTDWASDQL